MTQSIHEVLQQPGKARISDYRYGSDQKLTALQMYILCAQIVETYSGKSLADFVGERILTPLNMTASTYSGSEAASTGLMSQAWSLGGRRIPYIFADDWLGSTVAGPGSLISNVINMVSKIRCSMHFVADTQSNLGQMARYACQWRCRPVHEQHYHSKLCPLSHYYLVHA